MNTYLEIKYSSGFNV